ncbi:pentapeptide repeat-containing protein [Saccharopolyspora sp. NPDC050389]|uniref:pentapeptide repeat-containing protein n=1 Tax=Saccharopolyspora sp. NPDC050389 TaxID=3155516 RepID=UPI0033EC8925
MSDLGYLICSPCRVYLALGKPVLRDGGSVDYFHIGPASSPRNPTRPLLNESLWKFLADHTKHPLTIGFDYEAGMEEVEETYTEIGGHAADCGIPFEQYLLDWNGLSLSGFDSATLESLRRPAVRIEHFDTDITPPATAIHVDLPESALKRWRDERDEHPIRAIGVSGTSQSSSLVRNLGLPSPYFLGQIGDIAASRVVLGHFEQLWTENRPVAIELLHSLPRTLAKVRKAGRSLHLALSDLGPGSTDAILTELRNAPSGGIGEPITVFDYPPAAQNTPSAPSWTQRAGAYSWQPRRWPNDPAVAGDLRIWLEGNGHEVFYAIASDVRGADFTGGYLVGAWFMSSDLTGTVLRDMAFFEAVCTEARFTGCDLTDTDLSEANLDRADLTGTSLVRADLLGASAMNAIFRDADLSGAVLRLALLSGASFTNADLTGCNLDRAVLSGANLSGAQVSGTTGSIRGPVIVCKDHRTVVLDGTELAQWFHDQGSTVTVRPPEVPARGSRPWKSEQDELVKIRVMIDWEAYPIWLNTRTGDTSFPVPAEDLLKYATIPGHLIKRIDEWHDQWTALLNWDDPLSTWFPTPEAEEQWWNRGLALTELLAEHFDPRIRIEYSAGESKRVIRAGELDE